MELDIERLFSGGELASLSSDAPTPLYFQMYTLLKNRILDGTIAHGTQMPTERELAESFNISRITAKRAMDELAAEALVERCRGKGTHVTHHYKLEKAQAPLTGMLQKLASMGRDTQVKVLDVGYLIPPGDIRNDFGLAGEEKLLRVLRVRMNSEGEPFAYYISWTTGIKTGGTKADLESRVRYDIMKENGLEVSKIEQYLGACNAEEFVSSELDMSIGDPLLTLSRRSYTDDDHLVDTLFCYYNPKRFQYSMTISMDEYRG